MTHVDWSIKGPEIAACNCEWGCPCQFNALPSHGNCRATAAMRIDEGHFGDVRLDGLKFVGMFAWPRAIHEGHGEGMAVSRRRSVKIGSTSSAGVEVLSGLEGTERIVTHGNEILRDGQPVRLVGGS